MGYSRVVHYATALALTGIPVPAQAAMTGNELLTYCEAARGSQPFNLCMTYAAGVSHGSITIAIMEDRQKPFCEPSTVDAGQRADIIAKWLRENPKGRDLPAVGLIIYALMDAYPCEKK
jgi:hypothetical protein